MHYYILHLLLLLLPPLAISVSSLQPDLKQAYNGCDLFQGSWVLDTSYPLYDANDCPFVGLNCGKHGRPDRMYLQYRWSPEGCNNISRFVGKVFLEKMRGKKIMFVGDSLSRNQWESLGCLLHTAVPDAKYSFVSRGGLAVIYFPEFRVSVMYQKNGFFIRLANHTLKLDELIGSKQWMGADVLIFNSYHWWLHTGRSRTWENYQVGDQIYQDMDVMEAYRIALTTWANWVDSNIDPATTRVFYQGISASHYHGSEWNEPNVESCKGQTRPVEGPTYPVIKPPGDAVVKSVLGRMKKPAILLDILLLTQLRKDGHPSVYVGGGLDCSHWCLAGVPDTWNQLLYTILIDG